MDEYQRTVAKDVAKTILLIVAAGAIVVAVAAMPGIGGVFKLILDARRVNKRYERDRINRSVRGLVKRKVLEVVPLNDGRFEVRITDKGRRRVSPLLIESLTLPTPPRQWDKKWRLVVFDVPYQFDTLRAIFRRKLKQLGFTYLQRSVWIYPYPCERELSQLADQLAIRKYVIIARIDELENDAKLRSRYKL